MGTFQLLFVLPLSQTVVSGLCFSTAGHTRTVKRRHLRDQIIELPGREKMNVEVIHGNIEDQQTDVIVNSTTTDLTLSKGWISGSILKAAGQELQTECYNKYPQGIKYGDVATTKGWNLHCKYVYHIILPKTWKSNRQITIKLLQGTVQKCLQTADDAGHKSISFPLLGTGRLQYPCDTVTDVITGTVNSFKAKSIDKVTIVVPPTSHAAKRTSKDVTVKVKNKLSKTDSSSGSSPEHSIIQTVTDGKIQTVTDDTTTNTVQQIHVCSDGSPKQTSKLPQNIPTPGCSSSPSSKNESTTQKTNIEFITGNIIHQKAEVIVLSAEPDLSFDRENLRRQVSQIAGSSLEEECKRKYPNGLQYGKLAFTSGGNLRCKQIYHLILPPWTNSSTSEKIFKAMIYGCLKTACLQKHKSIAFPLLGSGALKYPPDEISTWLLECIHDFDVKEQSTSRSLEEVQIVVLPDHIPTFESESSVILILEVGHKANLRRVPSESGCTHDWTVFVRSPNGSNLENVIARVDFNLHETFINPKISVSNPPFEVSESGYGGFLLPIQIYCGSDTVPKKTIQYAMYLNKPGEPPVDHSQRETLIFRNPNKQFQQKLLEAGGVLEKKNGSSSSIVEGIESPTNWSSDGQNTILRIVPLLASDVEYKEVAQNFSASLGKHTIVSIERIQNCTLYILYQTMKRHFQTRNPGIENEMTLWHGTTAEATESINRNGFNRSYCGKNATVFGKGVYFARSSRLSAHEKYSPKDPRGLKRMYQAKVLTGQYTNGHSSFKVPPSKDASRPYDRYDCVVDDTNKPEIFVIFQDAQAYPCYLVTFY